LGNTFSSKVELSGCKRKGQPLTYKPQILNEIFFNSESGKIHKMVRNNWKPCEQEV